MYIGQTTDIDKRWKNNRINAYKGSAFIYSAFQKYGWDSFEHIILEDDVPDECLDKREQYWIKKYHTFIEDPEYKGGFNLTEGGAGGKGPKYNLKGKLPKNLKFITELKLTPIKVVNSGEWNGIKFHEGQSWNSILECAEYFNMSRSRVSTRVINPNNTETGPIFVYVNKENGYDETLRRQRQLDRQNFFKNNGERLARTHKTGSRIDYNIYCRETGQIFSKVSDCLKEFNMSRSTLNGHILYPEKHPTAKGLHFERVSKTNIDS